MVLDALVNIEENPESKMIGSIENLWEAVPENSPDLFSIDLVSLILRLSAPVFARR